MLFMKIDGATFELQEISGHIHANYKIEIRFRGGNSYLEVVNFAIVAINNGSIENNNRSMAELYKHYGTITNK